MTETDDIRIAWNKVTERLCAVHPDGKKALTPPDSAEREKEP